MIYFLSDAHLGSRAITDPIAHQNKVIGLLHQMANDADEIYLLGDIFDFWYEYIGEKNLTLEHLSTSKKPYLPFLKCLKELSDKGIRLHFFIGNHDIWTFGLIARLTGAEVHRSPIETTCYGKHILMGHGDGLVPSHYLEQLPKNIQRKIRHFQWLRAFFHNPVPQFLFRLIPASLGDELGYEWARKSRQKELDNPFPYKGENHEELVLYAKEHAEQNPDKIDFYIFGHRHIELDLQITSRARVLILGDMFQQWTYASLSPEGEMTLCAL